MRRRHSLFYIFLILSFFIFFPSSAFASGPHLVINGKQIEGELIPVIIKGRMLVSVRVVSEELGAQVDWDSRTKTAKITGDNTTILIPVGKRQLSVNGKTFTVDVPAQFVKNRVYMPLRFLAENLGAAVEWDQASSTSIVNKGPGQLNGAEVQVQDQGILLHLAGDRPIQCKLVQSAEQTTVFDLPLTQFPAGSKSFQVEKGGIQTVTIEQISDSPATTRITVATDGKAPYIIDNTSEKNGLKISFPYQVSGIEQVKDGDNETFFIRTNSPSQPNTMQLTGPDRFVVDIPNAVMWMSNPNITFDSKIVTRVRVAQFTVNPNTTRVVFELKQPLQGKVVTDNQNGEMAIVFSPRITSVSSQDLGDRTRLTLTSSHPLGQDYQIKQQGNYLYIDFPFMSWGLPSGNYNAGGKALTRVTAGQLPGNTQGVRVTAELPFYYRHQVVASDPNSLVIDFFSSPLAGKTIVVDPGHGGVDSGAVAIDGSFEKDDNLSIATILIDKLQAAGMHVIATRTDDSTVSLAQRYTLANNAGADLFVSIHHNEAQNSAAGGIETYYYTNHPDSKKLATAVQSKMVQELGLNDRGAKLRELAVTKNTVMPSVLVEVAFLSNPTEAALAKDPAFREKAAEGIFEGIADFLSGEGNK